MVPSEGGFYSNYLKPVVRLSDKITFEPEGPFSPPQDLVRAPRSGAKLLVPTIGKPTTGIGEQLINWSKSETLFQLVLFVISTV